MDVKNVVIKYGLDYVKMELQNILNSVEKQQIKKEKIKMKKEKIFILTGVTAIFLIIGIFLSCYSVRTGEVAIISNWGKFQESIQKD